MDGKTKKLTAIIDDTFGEIGNKQHAAIVADFDTVDERIDELARRHAALVQRIDNAIVSLTLQDDALAARVSALEPQPDGASEESELESLREMNAAQAKTIDELKADLSESQLMNDTHENTIEALREIKGNQAGVIRDLQSDISALRSINEQLRTQLARVREAVGQ